jgi:hypothetical protein
MRWIRTVASEVFGLFVDDGSFAVAILVWLGLCWLLLPRIGVPPSVMGPVLFVGLAAILVESAARRARR